MSERRQPLPLRVAAVEVAGRLLDAGFIAYFAGGCVRDRLLGSEPEDYDIATDARPDAVQRLFSSAQGIGQSFGVMLVRFGGHAFEVATFRADGPYEDGRRPVEVRYTDAEEDAGRRDFTINGLFEEPRTGRVVDFVDGQNDLTRKVVRAIGDAGARFAEDHLRLLRAPRFAARLGFELDGKTADAVRRFAPRLTGVARERVGAELRRMLEAPSRVRAVHLLQDLGLDRPTLGEEGLASSPPIERFARLASLPSSAPFDVALAAWGLDRTGPGTEVDLETATIDRWREALALSNREEDGIRAVIECRRQAFRWSGMDTAARKRWAARPHSAWSRFLLVADAPDTARAIEQWLGAIDPATIAPVPLVTGDDLVRIGLRPGPAFRDLLEATYDAQLDGRCSTQADALAYVRTLAETRGIASG